MKMKESTKQKAKSRFYEKTNGFEMLTDFIGWDEPISIRCNACGHIFERSYQNIRYKNGLSCPKCRHEATEARRLAGEQEAREARNKQFAIDEEERRRKVVAERCKGFSYVGNYTGSEGTADIQCNTCGAILTRSWITIRHSKVSCDNCERLKRKANFKPLRKPPQGVQLSLNISTKQCEECGTMFVSKMGNEKYCSKCRKRVANRNKDKRINRANIVNRDISLKKLYKRDNGICYICGVRCDFEDHHTEDGNFIVGPTYPTIEHVFPLSRGGLHSWDNVRLACHACNSKKWAHLPEQIE